MIRKSTYCAFLCLLWLGFSSCDDKEATAPPSPSFTIDRTSGLAFDDVFTFTIDEVDADAVVVLPEGQESNTSGVIVSSFVNGKATVQFSYSHVGTFKAIVVASNWSDDGGSVERSFSETIDVTITSDDATLTEFKIGDVAGKILNKEPENSDTVDITLPHDPYGVSGITALKAAFATSPYATVKIGSTTQVSNETANNFSTPLTYTVTSQDGSTSRDYYVKVTVTPISDDTDIKSASGKVVSKAGEDSPFKSGDAFAAYVDNAAHVVAVVLPFNFPENLRDSIRLSITVNNEFAKAKYGTENFKQDTLLNLTTSKTVKVVAQDGTEQDYTVVVVNAPKLELSFQGLNPVVNGTTSGFTVSLNVLKGTNVESLATTAVTSGDPVTAITIKDADNDDEDDAPEPFNSGDAVNFSKSAEFELTANGSVTFKVKYTATVKVLP